MVSRSVWVYPLTGDAWAELQRPDDRQVWGLGQPVGEVPSETRRRSLFGHLGKARPAGNGCCLFPLSQTPAPFACQDIDCGLFLVIIAAKDSFP